MNANHSIPLLALAGFFVVVGLALFALTFKPAKPTSATPGKKELREKAELEKETNKMRLAGAVLVVFGVVLMFIF